MVVRLLPADPAEQIRVIANPVHQAILEKLCSGEQIPAQIAKHIKSTEAVAFQRLRVLYRFKLVRRRRYRGNTFYFLNPEIYTRCDDNSHELVIGKWTIYINP